MKIMIKYPYVVTKRSLKTSVGNPDPDQQEPQILPDPLVRGTGLDLAPDPSLFS